MLRQTIQYVDFNDEPQEETLYFNISKTELADNLHLKQEFEEIEKIFQGPLRELTTTEVRLILNLVKTFMQLSYGKRSEDGKHFHKTAKIWEDFKSTAAYDEFLYSLFKDPQKAVDFLVGVLPADLREQAEAHVKQNQPDLFKETHEGVLPDPNENSKVEGDTRPAWLREDRDPTDFELRHMSREELLLAMGRKSKNSQ